jgi:sialate O-acetylesterase
MMLKRVPIVVVVGVVAALAAAMTSRADVRPNPLFADHMVLQRGDVIPVWGTAAPGERVTVTFAGQTRETTAGADGAWRIELRDLVAGGPHTLSMAGTNVVTLSDVFVGDVWLCAGQSNMEWALARCTGGEEAVDRSPEQRFVRLCTIPHACADEPQSEVAARWSLPDPKVTRFFSGVAWWFATKLQREIDVPVGVINCSYGGTTIQAWMPGDVLARGPWPKDASTDVSLSRADYDKRRAALQPVMDRYLAEKAEAVRNGRSPPPHPAGWPGDFRGPTRLWNGMLRRSRLCASGAWRGTKGSQTPTCGSRTPTAICCPR